MQLTERHFIREGSEQCQELTRVAHLSKNLFNATLYAVRQHFFETGKYLPFAKVCNDFTSQSNSDYVALPRKVSQGTMRLVDKSFKSFFQSLTQYKVNPSKFKGRPKLPKYKDKNGAFIVEFNNQAVSRKDLNNDGVIHPSGTNIHISSNVKYDDLDCVRIVPVCGGFYVEVVYTTQEAEPKPDNGRYASIDLGIDNLATVVSNIPGFETFAVDGRYLKSYNHWDNKEKARLKPCAETYNGTKTTKRLRKLEADRRNVVSDYMHKASRLIVNQLVSNDVCALYVGHNKGWKQDTNMGRVNNQNFVEIPHTTFIAILKYKCKLAGIAFHENEESYTSKCSFLDNEEICKHDVYAGQRVHRGLFRSSDGTLINADVNGAWNILRKCKPEAFADGVVGVVVHPVIARMANGFIDFH